VKAPQNGTECPGEGRKRGEDRVRSTDEEGKSEKSRQRKDEEALGEACLSEERRSNSD
jgi:hypothetical protein